MPTIKLPYTEEGEGLVKDVEADVEAIGGEVIYPTNNAMDRVENYQLGGQVKPPTAPSIMPAPQYKKGGKVEK